MFNGQRIAISRLRRAGRLWPSTEGLAAAAAAGGEPGPLLAAQVASLDSASASQRQARGMSSRAPQGGAQSVGTLLSVNVGMPKEVPWRGKTVFTGVFKDPVTGPRRARKLNVDGDGQGDRAGHGGEQRAVFVYQTDSYRYWERELGRDDFAYGQFGENFTVEGLADDEVCIGDRYRIGTAVFEVTQPRVTCYRVGIRMDDPRIPALLVSHRRPGFYFRVLEEGEIEAGDDIVKLAPGPEQMTIAEINGLLYLPGHSRQQLLRALRIPALSPGWQASFRALLEGQPGSGNAGLTTASPPPAWSGFRRLTVTAIERESDSVLSIRLEEPDGAALPPARPGQYLTLRIQPDPGQRPLLRNYSLSGPPGAGYYRISVKREHDGAASGYLHTVLHTGDQLEVAAPRGTFILDASAAPLLLITAGIGATPALAMLHALAKEHSEREIWWLHGARNRRDHSFATESRALLASLPNVRIHVCYSRPGADDLEGRDFDSAGRLSGALLAELGLPRDAEAYVCGPAPFMEQISAALAAIGLDASRIHTEPFGPAPGLTPGIASAPARSPHPPPGEPGHGPTIEFARTNLAVRWNDDYPSLLELAEACDVPVRWSCRTGVCHNCETTLIAGTLDYDPEPVEPPADGSALICCARPHDNVVLDL
jgi:ferredoxin-NADP reductase/MOSC domain-containing protein YiiM/ferredoxin